MRSLVTRLTTVAILGIGVLMGGMAVPAAACACGAYITNTDTSIGAERAAIKFDGTAEDLVVSMTVLGSSPDAAWIMPVPAQAELSLQDLGLFEELSDRTRPKEEKVTNWWPNFGFLDKLGITTPDDGASGSGVEVLEQQTLGPYTTAQLAANDPAALTAWLQANGYQPDEALTAAAEPYAAAGWVFVAVKLTPLDAATPLTGALQPMLLRFASAEPVYPMRLSQLAQGTQDVELYVIAPYRVEPAFTAVPGTPPDLIYAGWLDPGEIGPVSAVGQWLTDRAFLVRYDQTITDPSTITGDYTFAQADGDEEFQAVLYVDRDLGWLSGGLLAVLALILLAVIPTRLMYRRKVRQEYAARAEENAAV